MKPLLLQLVRGYQLLLRPWLGNQCRFIPTCSDYALQALEAHGAVHGSYLTAGRVLRCHPWCAGGYDPVPAPGPAQAPMPMLPIRYDHGFDDKREAQNKS